MPDGPMAAQQFAASRPRHMDAAAWMQQQREIDALSQGTSHSFAAQPPAQRQPLQMDMAEAQQRQQMQMDMAAQQYAASQPSHMGGQAAGSQQVPSPGPWLPDGGLQLHPSLAGLEPPQQYGTQYPTQYQQPPPPMPQAGAHYPILGMSAPRLASPDEVEQLHRVHGSAADAALGPQEDRMQELGQELPPVHSTVRVRVNLPKARFPGAPEFYGQVPKRSSTFGWSELCATGAPDHSLAPVPQAQTKTWYNSYVYVPEERSHVERQFQDRFVQGADGEWIDVVKARRMASYLSEKREKAMVEKMERAMVMSGSVMQETRYTDPYSGEHLVACRGELLPKQQLLEQYSNHYSATAIREMMSSSEGFDFDNLRVPWPFGRPYRNKQVSQHAYDWFDRQNPYIRSDKSFELMELPSMYVDRHHYDRWGGSSVGAGNYDGQQRTMPAGRVQMVET